MAVAVAGKIDGPGVVTVTYDGKTPWGQSVPYVSIVREPIFYGGKWGQIANITLSGEISQYSYDYSKNNQFVDGAAFTHTLDYPTSLRNLEQIRDDIIKVFSNSLKVFEFEDTTGHKMTFPNAIVESIDFPTSGYWAKFEFSITLKCYEQDYFMAQGIVDAVDQFQTNENENGTLNVTHTISARGINYTDASGDTQYGLSNAITWVDSRKGDQYKSEEGLYTAWWGGSNSHPADPTPASTVAAGKANKINLVLLSQDETINRLEGTYQISETFIGYLGEEENTAARPFGRRFSVNINESLTSDFNVVEISGEYTGGRNTSLKELREGFVNDNPTGNPTLAAEPQKMLYEKAKELSGFDGTLIADCGAEDSPGSGIPIPGAGTHRPLLYDMPTGFSVEESETNKSIQIKASFDTNSLFANERWFFNHKISIKMNEVTNVTSVNIDGQLEVRGLFQEKQFYIEEFLNGRDVMNFLWSRADEQHGIIGKNCWECKGGVDADGNAIDHWIRADIGDTRAEAVAICTAHPYGGAPDAAAAPERCHELNQSASSLSMVQNKVKGTLNLSATFNDEDTLPILADYDGDDCWTCEDGAGDVGYALAPSAAEALTNCANWFPLKTITGATACTDINLSCCDDLKTYDYGKASWDVSVNSPIDYAQVNASAQKIYNGHWAIQKFGIKTREKATVKVSLDFREDNPYLPINLFEKTLRNQAKDTVETLHDMFDQNYLPAIDPATGNFVSPEPSPVYDVSESVSHKTTKGDKLTHSLERSYQPDEANAICVDIALIGDQKDCFVCVDLSGNIATSTNLGSNVYAYNDVDAQGLCDLIAIDLGFSATISNDPNTHTYEAQDCGDCWQCIDSNMVILDRVYAADGAEADTKCQAIHPYTAPTGTAVVLQCDVFLPTFCYQCMDMANADTGDVPDVLLHPSADGFETFDLAAAENVCGMILGVNWTGGSLCAGDCVVRECPDPVLECWTCYYFGEIFGYVFAGDNAEALDECAGIGWAGLLAADPDLFADNMCDFNVLPPTP